MKIVNYNIHYAIGKDGQYDLNRIANTVRGADIIALQEVERNYGSPDGPSQPEEIAQLLPDYYWVFEAAFDIDGSQKSTDGTVFNLRRQHGQMLLSRWPILTKRYYPLPRMNIKHAFNMQMGVLEGVLSTSTGLLRVYNVHFGSVSSEERQRQAKFLVSLVRDAPFDGGAWTGPAREDPERDWSAGMAQLPMPHNALVLGDFNMLSTSPEYEIMVTTFRDDNKVLLTDIWQQMNLGSNVFTWHPIPERSGKKKSARLDYCFVTSELITLTKSSWVDEDAIGSDHQPLWVELDKY